MRLIYEASYFKHCSLAHISLFFLLYMDCPGLLCVEKVEHTQALAGVEVTSLEDRVVAHTYGILR